jgi:hypothetical protein
MIAFSRKNKRKKVMSLTVLLAKRFGGEVARWRGGEVARWRGGEVARWRGGEVK